MRRFNSRDLTTPREPLLVSVVARTTLAVSYTPELIETLDAMAALRRESTQSPLYEQISRGTSANRGGSAFSSKVAREDSFNKGRLRRFSRTAVPPPPSLSVANRSSSSPKRVAVGSVLSGSRVLSGSSVLSGSGSARSVEGGAAEANAPKREKGHKELLNLAIRYEGQDFHEPVSGDLASLSATDFLNDQDKLVRLLRERLAIEKRVASRMQGRAEKRRPVQVFVRSTTSVYRRLFELPPSHQARLSSSPLPPCTTAPPPCTPMLPTAHPTAARCTAASQWLVLVVFAQILIVRLEARLCSPAHPPLLPVAHPPRRAAAHSPDYTRPAGHSERRPCSLQPSAPPPCS